MKWRTIVGEAWMCNGATIAPENPAGYRLAVKRWRRLGDRCFLPAIWLISRPTKRRRP